MNSLCDGKNRVTSPVSPQTLAIACALAAVIAWSSAFVGIRFALREISPGPLVFLRFLVASVCFLCFVAAKQVRLPQRRDVPQLLLISFLGQAVYQFSLSFAQKRITAGAAGVLIALVPVLSAVFAIPVLKERLSSRAWIGMVTSFAGVVLISFGANGSVHFEPMSLLGVVAAASSAGYFVLQKPWLTRYTPLELTAYGIWTGMFTTLIFMPELPSIFRGASASTLLTVIYLGVVPTALGYTLWSYALSHSPASQVSSFLYLEPIVTFLLAWMLLRETPTLAAIVGTVFILVGVSLVNKRKPPLSGANESQ
jgi:drug/metabolite transporter (DMT)-like permease